MSGYAIYSCEGFSREILPSLRQQVPKGGVNSIVFVEDDPAKCGKSVHGCRVISFETLQTEAHRNRLVNVGIADPWLRRRVVNKCDRAGFAFTAIEDSTHVRFENVEIGEGAVFCAFTMTTGDLKIGAHFHCNIYSYVAHDCEIGDFVTFAPRVCCNGRVRIKDFAYIGTGAQIKQGQPGRPLTIGRGAIVGMGAVVLSDVPDGAVVAGNPARIIRMIEHDE